MNIAIHCTAVTLEIQTQEKKTVVVIVDEDWTMKKAAHNQFFGL